MKAASNDDAQHFRPRAFEVIQNYTMELAKLKNVPLHPKRCGNIASVIIDGLTPAQFRCMGKAEGVVIPRVIHLSLDSGLDYDYAWIVVHSSITTVGLGASVEMKDRLVETFYDRVSGHRAADPQRPMLRWPTTEALKDVLLERIGHLPASCSPDDLLKALLYPTMVEPITGPMMYCEA